MPVMTPLAMPVPRPATRAYLPLAWSNLAAQAAEQLCLAAVPIVAVMAFHAGPGEVGLLTGAQTLPFLLLSIPLGLLADRVSRRSLMLAAEGLRALTLLALAVLVTLGLVSMPVLAVLGFVGAIGTVGFSVAAPALLPALVPRESLARANSHIELARSLAFAGGPALAGSLVAWAGGGVAFVVAAVLSTAAVLMMARLQEPPRTLPPARHPWLDLRQGGGFVWRHALLKPILLTAVAWNLAWCVLQAAYVPWAMHNLGLSAAGVGFTLAAYGVGMVLGALTAGRVIRALPYGAAVMLGPLVSVLAAGVMAASTLWPWPALAAVSFFLFGAGPILWTISSTTLRQHLTPHDLLGRVGAIFLTVNAGARPVGALIGAWVGARHGAAACLWLALAGFVVQAWVISASPVRSLRRLEHAA
jgi:predicted MFS family arabinose efflux permease